MVSLKHYTKYLKNNLNQLYMGYGKHCFWPTVVYDRAEKINLKQIIISIVSIRNYLYTPMAYCTSKQSSIYTTEESNLFLKRDGGRMGLERKYREDVLKEWCLSVILKISKSWSDKEWGENIPMSKNIMFIAVAYIRAWHGERIEGGQMWLEWKKRGCE